ncbi:MAG TPA: hypothetical protein VKU90_06095 [Caulobacteraceae bacterium]|nr:hypothetical protein [Caulobacteraceae bacterium]
MTEAFNSTAAPALRITPGWPSTPVLLADGGDARVALDAATGRNAYGCAPTPETLAADVGSCTASTISPRGFAAAQALNARLAGAAIAPAAAYARELERIRRRLLDLCGLGGQGVEVIFAASGTDLHLIAAALAGGSPDRPLVAIGVEPSETGSGVPAALAGKHYSTRTALAETVIPGDPAGAAGQYVAIAARDADGKVRDAADVEAELDAIVLAAQSGGRRALLTLADVSKTGLIAPGPGVALALARRFPRTLDVMVDACQFRLAPESLSAYLRAGFMVAMTGSKFLTGPTFAGALLAPASVAERLRSRILPPGLRAYSARADWPAGWVGRAGLPDVANLGLLLRWEAALAELAAFRALPQAELEGFMRAFARVIRQRLADDPAFAPLATRRLDRSAIGAFTGWDRSQSIFGFLVRRPEGRWLAPAETAAVHRSLLEEGGIRLGQPVGAGRKDGVPVSALRICNSARLAVQAVGPGGDPAAVMAAALASLDRVARAARALA